MADFKTISEIRRDRYAADAARQAIGLNEQTRQINDLKIQDARREMQEAQAVRDTFAQSKDPDEALGKLRGMVSPATWDGVAKTWGEYRKNIGDTAKQKADLQKAQDSHIAHAFLNVADSGYNPAVLDSTLSMLETNDDLKDEVAGFRQLLSQRPDPEARKQLVEHLISQSPDALETRRKGQEEQRLRDAAQETARHNLETEKPKPTDEQRNFTDYYQSFLQGRAPNAALEWEARQKFATRTHVPTAGQDIPLSPEVEAQRKRITAAGAAVRANAADSALTPQGLDMAAEQFYATGFMPSLGMGAAGVRQAIINRAAQLHPGGNLAASSAEYKANSASLTQLQKNRDAVAQFEKTAQKNLTLFLNQARRVIDSGSPFINTPLRLIKKGAVGDADLAAYEAARRVAINEIARVTSNPNLTGVMSDAARQEVESFVPENSTLGQVYAVARTLQQDMANRMESIDEQITAIKSRLGSGGAQATGGGPKPTHRYNPATRKLEAIQ